MTDTSDLGPLPEPRIEPGEPNPGGVDALPEVEDHAIPDLSPEANVALDQKTSDSGSDSDSKSAKESVKDEMSEGEDTSTVATRSEDGHHEESEKEPPV